MNDKIQEFKRLIIEGVKLKFNLHKQVKPTFFGLKENAVKVYDNLDVFFSEDSGKKLIANMIQSLAKEDNLPVLAFVTEAWALTTKKDKQEELINPDGSYKVRPSESEDRVEILLLTFETKDKEAKITWEIERNHVVNTEGELEEIVSLKEVMNCDWEDKTSEGTFSNLLG